MVLYLVAVVVRYESKREACLAKANNTSSQLTTYAKVLPAGGYTIASPACPAKLAVVTTIIPITSTNLSIGKCSTIYHSLQIASLLLVNTTICKLGLLVLLYCLCGT